MASSLLLKNPLGERLELDGVFRLVFSRVQGTLQCTILEEWWHGKES